MKKLLAATFLHVFGLMSVSAQPPSTEKSIALLEKDIPQLMDKADIPGMSAALIRDGKIVWVKSFGVINADTKVPVNNSTIFEAASLSKVVFTYAVMKLVDQGKLDLDVPLNKYLGNNYDVGDDARLNLITARRVLSHTSGFPNWRARDSKTLPINFTPGEKFSYSGEGFVYLSKVVELITKMNLEDFMQQTVLIPLGMKSSSYTWLPAYNTIAVHRHNSVGKVSFRNQGTDFNAAASLRTTAEDYGKFVVVLLNGEGLQPATWKQMLTAQVNVNEKSPQVFWGLGVGLEQTENGKSFWHWGDQGDSKAYVTADIAQKNAIIYFANSANGLSITQEILTDAIGEKHPGVAWLNYDRYDSPAKLFFKLILAKGAVAALKEYHEQQNPDSKQKITEAQVNTMGYQLMNMSKMDDALILFQQNVADYPQSGNAWDSFAEANMNKGNKELAIKYYEKAIELDPSNKNAVEQVKKLKGS